MRWGLLFLAVSLNAQLTTGMLEGAAVPGSAVVITGGAGFRLTVHADSHGRFHAALPYGHYRVNGAEVEVSPLGTTRLNPRTYPEGYSLATLLMDQEPASVAAPLDLTGLVANRLGLESQRGLSWADTQFRLLGMDATDAYQPGRPLILPDVEALDTVVVRNPGVFGTEVGMFMAEPSPQWHGAVSTAGTGSALASSNLPPPYARTFVQAPARFDWFTRDRAEISAPIANRADVYASAAGQWSEQTIPAGQRSRILYANARGRLRAGAHDQIEAEYNGSRVDLSNWGLPAAIEAWAGRRMAPPFPVEGGFAADGETDHLDFAQLGWTRFLPDWSGIFQFRYGYSTAHLDTYPSTSILPDQSRIEMLTGAVTGAPPVSDLAVRTRHEIAAAWQPAVTGHQIVIGADWELSTPRNRFSAPLNLITADAAPAFVLEFNTPTQTKEIVRSFSLYAADDLQVGRLLSLQIGALADFSRGGPVAWNSISPRAGFAVQVPHAHGLVLRGSYFRLYAPLAARYLDFGNPNSLAGNEYQWIDRNGDGWFEPGEMGPLLMRFGGPYSSISPSLHRPYADEFDIGAAIWIARIHLFRRDDKSRIAAINDGVQAFTPRTIIDPGPDGIFGTFDDQQLTVYEQNPATFGQDHYTLTNPPGLRMLNEGLTAEIGTHWRGFHFHASFTVEKSFGPTNPGNAVVENDPGVVGALFMDPNTTIHATGHIFTDRAFVGKIEATYRLPYAIDLSSIADYNDGLVFARELLVTGLAQGPFLVPATIRGSPEGGNRAQYAVNWNLRLARVFRLPFGRITATADILNVTNVGKWIEESDLTGPAFNLRLPTAIQPPRFVRAGFRYEF